MTIDAGPNVHCLCLAEDSAQVEASLRRLPGVQDVRVARPGGGVRLVDRHLL